MKRAPRMRRAPRVTGPWLSGLAEREDQVARELLTRRERRPCGALGGDAGVVDVDQLRQAQGGGGKRLPL